MNQQPQQQGCSPARGTNAATAKRTSSAAPLTKVGLGLCSPQGFCWHVCCTVVLGGCREEKGINSNDLRATANFQKKHTDEGREGAFELLRGK